MRPGRARLLGSQKIQLVNHRILRKKFLPFGEQRLCYFAVQMCFAALLIRERVENSKLRSAQPHRIPCNGSLLSFRQTLCRFQEISELLFFSWFCFQLHPNCKLRHSLIPPSSYDACTHEWLPRFYVFDFFLVRISSAKSAPNENFS